MSLWNETSDHMYSRYEIKVRTDRLWREGWEISSLDDDPDLIKILVEDPDGEMTEIIYINTDYILDRLWDLEWDYLSGKNKNRKSSVDKVFSNVRFEPLDYEVFQSFQSAFH